jgi:hypothetical protein
MITIVSGLPRSGTSLMMQMLQAGGHPVLCDDQRTADEHNPRGYLEYDKVRRLRSDNSWLSEAEGNAVKVVSLLLYHLPAEFEYRILFVRRNMEEVLRSQQRMLDTRGTTDGIDMRAHFERHLQSVMEWIGRQPKMRIHELNYIDLLNEPIRSAQAVASFLERDLAIDRMANAVDRGLHRQRAD